MSIYDNYFSVFMWTNRHTARHTELLKTLSDFAQHSWQTYNNNSMQLELNSNETKTPLNLSCDRSGLQGTEWPVSTASGEWLPAYHCDWSGVVVSALASINEVNLRQARLVLRWATVSGFNSRCRTLISVCNQPATQGQLDALTKYDNSEFCARLLSYYPPFVFHCTHVRMSYVLNSYLLTYLLTKWVPASAGKAKAGIVHSVSGCTRGVQVKLWDPLRTRAIPKCLRRVITTRCYTNPRLPLPLPIAIGCW